MTPTATRRRSPFPGDWRSKATTSAALGSVLGWIAAGVPVLMAGTHERPERYDSRLLYTAARRRWREARALVAPALDKTADGKSATES